MFNPECLRTFIKEYHSHLRAVENPNHADTEHAHNEAAHSEAFDVEFVQDLIIEENQITHC